MYIIMSKHHDDIHTLGCYMASCRGNMLHHTVQSADGKFNHLRLRNASQGTACNKLVLLCLQGLSQECHH